MEGSHLVNHHSTTVAYGLLNNNAPAMKVAVFQRFWEESEGTKDLSFLSNCHISFPQYLITSSCGGVDSLVPAPHFCPTILIVVILIIYYFVQKQSNSPPIVRDVVHVPERQISEYSTLL
jgi:hypothetical protein